MFIKSDMFDRLLCCRRKVIEDDHDDRVVEEVVLQHTNNNKTEYISSAQLVERLKGGTTAVVALVREKRLVVAWLGDSQALLVRRRNPVRMVEPHKPELPVERERVEEMGGCVINIQGTWRVLGQLAVSRAIGDADYKPYVSSECDIKSLEIEGDEDFLILACDGLWDTLSPEDAVNVVYAYLTHNNGDTDGVGRCLVEAARSTGSEDNITAVVVFLRPVATLMEEEAQRIAQGQVPENVPAVVMEKDSTPSSINAIFSPPIFSPPINQFELSENASPKSFSLFNADEFDTSCDMNNHNYTQSAVTPATDSFSDKDKDEPMEGSEAPMMFPPPSHDFDSDEGIAGLGAEGVAPPSTTPIFNPHDAPTPTAEEVDAALAELDSIPDGVCESGEVEEEEEDEEEWSYFRMEPQTQSQGEDILVGAPSATVTASPPTEDFEVLPEPIGMVHDQDIIPVIEDYTKTSPPPNFDEQNQESVNLSENLFKNELLENLEEKKEDYPSPMEADEAPLVVEKQTDFLQSSMDMIPSLDDHPEKMIHYSEPGFEKTPNLMDGPSSPHGSGSPHAPGSPRSVEGFVTSVELNTPDESFATNFAVNQAQDLFAGMVDQTSGPFSVYVSSSPEPASLDPPALSPVDLFDMPGVITNGQTEEEHGVNQTSQPQEESPVEIVHAQSTVEVVAPPSPVEICGPDTQFIIPEEVPNSPTSAQMPPTDISFVPQPVIEPTAEVPVPVYVDDTPVSEPEIIPDVEHAVNESAFNTMTLSQTAEELVSSSKMEMDKNFGFSNIESTTEIASIVDSTAETFSQMDSTVEMVSHVDSTTETVSHVESSEMVSHMESASEMVSHMESASEMVSHMESASEMVSHMESATDTHTQFESTAETIQSEMSQVPISPVPVVSSIEPTPASPVEPTPAAPVEHTPAAPIVAPVESSPLPTEVTDNITSPSVDTEVVSAPIVNIPEEAAPLAKSPEVVEAKIPAKATKTPAKTTEKAAAKSTLGKATPSRTTPGKATPTRTPSTKTPTSKTPATKTPTTRTPVTKSTEKKTTSRTATPTTARAPTSASKPTTAKPTTTRAPATKPAAAKPAAPKPSPTTRPAPTKTRTPLGTSKPTEKPTTKPSGATASRTASKPSGAAAKPTTTRPTPAARTTTTTTTRKPTTTAKSTDKTDAGKLVNGTSSRPSSRPATAKSTTTTARKPLASSTTRAAPKAAAEKETKNTTNQILSTRPAKTALSSTRTSATKTSAAHSTSKTTGMSKVSETTNTAKSRVTSTTRTTASKTTGAATKKTLVSKSKTSQAGLKEMDVKTKTEAAVIDTTEPLVNGENKIADEETSVEVIDKCAVEDIMQASTDKVITETMTSSEQVVTTETTEVLVNGDH